MSLTKGTDWRSGCPASRTETADASQRVRATRPKKPMRVAVRSSDDGSGELCTNVAHPRLAEKPSYAVLPSMTATVATSPRWPRRVLTPCRGVRSTQRPSSRRPRGASRPSSRDHASNGSAWSNHVRPNTAAPRSEMAKKDAMSSAEEAERGVLLGDELDPGEGAEAQGSGPQPPAVGEQGEVGRRPARAAAPRCGAGAAG